MASIGNDPGGFRRILFVAADGKRKTLRLGKVARRQAESVKVHVEHLVSAVKTRTAAPPETATWLSQIDDALYSKLAKVGLAAPRVTAEVVTLAKFLDCYIASRTDVKPSTATVYGHTRRCLVEFFGAGKPLAEITIADAAKFKRWLETSKFERTQGGSGNRKLSDSTVCRRYSIARQFFNEAVDDRAIVENPFRKLKGIGVKANRVRDYFITRQAAAKVLDACPDNEWRLLFALSRYGGLRCPSEHLALTWDDVDWERGRLTVHVPKLEHRGPEHATRVIPIFPELRPYLERAWDEAPEGATFIIARYRAANVNLRTQLERIIRRAGLKPWEKLFQNLRATRQTELANDYPEHVACKWIGNSESVAKRHYLQVTDAHFEAAQKAAQQASATTGMEQQLENADAENAEKSELYSESGMDSVGDAGLEPATSTL
jgi:integrase